MLIELSIRNFAIIPQLDLSFQEGLTVMTGETGAGKSIVLDAISLLIGGRSSIDYIRHGEKKAEIEGFFQLPIDHPVQALLYELGIEIEENSLILRRDISIQGKSICRINGKLVTLAILREVGQALLDIHGQHEHQLLMHEEKYLSLLDGYGRDEIEVHKKEYKDLYRKYKKITDTLQKLTENEKELAHRLDLLRFQLDEIQQAELEIGEDERLNQEKRKIRYAEKLFSGISSSYQALSGDSRALDSLTQAMNALEELSHIDEELEPVTKQVESIYFQLEEVTQELRKYQHYIEFEPQELNIIESRLVELEQLKRKYGRDVSAILEYASKIEEELDTIENREERVDELKKEQHEIAMDLIIEARNLTEIRQAVAQRLVTHIKEELQGLFMDQTEIAIHIQPLTTGVAVEVNAETRYIKQEGWDDVQILISPNPGEPLKPISKIASGGELARLMLALKSVFSQVESVTTLIFDEVDTGVSGRVAQAMAEKLHTLSQHQQVLCISHHAQVAAMSDVHLYISKEFKNNQTITNVVPISDQERVQELARMMSGAEITEGTVNFAMELLEAARRMKEK
ncbi:DNA repair protein RecN [Caldalkalibacillus mannanilyticus]|uniref:DNA repair protein RecN n=1 Tax=Caldalkalibacillus mannanilyticus TaxID=1418 RepID=UPI000468DC1C|nr:DNA repair protein RecN [Caldalkalibacillus mannanilyticus]